MRGDVLAQRLAQRLAGWLGGWLGGWLIGRACRHLPAAAREERGREWTAEPPAILADPDVRSGLLRSARALRFAAGTIRPARCASRRARSGPPTASTGCSAAG